MRVFDPSPSYFNILGLFLYPDEVEPFEHSRLAGGAGAAKRIKHDSAGWGDKAAQVAHQLGRLDGGVDILAGCLGSAGVSRRLRAGRSNSSPGDGRPMNVSKPFQPFIAITLASLSAIKITRGGACISVAAVLIFVINKIV